MEKINKDIDDIKCRITSIEIEIAKMNMTQDFSKCALSEIQDDIKALTQGLIEHQGKPDAFKETMFSYGVKVVEKILIALFIFYILDTK